jgi:RND family efflux transporter MFP subunit
LWNDVSTRKNKGLKRLFLVFIIGGLLFLGGVGALRWVEGSAVEVVHPIRGPAVRAVYATGTVEASVMMPIAARGGARLMELNVDEGSQVNKGQVLARLEDEDLRQSLNELRAREDLARQEYSRNAALMKKNTVSKGAYDKARADWEASKAAVRAAQAQMDYMTLTAPEAGTVIRRDGEVGQLIPANQAVFWLSCCAPLRISAEVDEEDVALVQPGQKVLIRADAFPDRVFQGSVQGITPKGDPVARSFRVRIGFTGDTPLLIGMTAETNIVIRETPDALLVPTEAVAQGQVWVVKEGRLMQREVSTGAVGPKQTEILGGLDNSDWVVARPTEDLLEGQKARTRIVPHGQ